MSLLPGSRQRCEVWTFISNAPVCISDVLPASRLARPVRGLCLQRLRTPLGMGFGSHSAWRFSMPGQFSSAFVLVWFVEHVVYGEGLYFLEFDELQIKEDQMNGHVTGGCTLCRGAVQRFGASRHAHSHSHTHTHDHMWMHEYSESFFYRHTSFCLLTGALGLIRPYCPTWTESIQDNG